MKGLYKAAAALVLVAACGRDGAITEPTAPTAPRAPLATPASGWNALGVDPKTGASIETNKDDYAPGEVVHVVGKGWAPGEKITLHMTEDPDTHADVDMDVIADNAGAFNVHYYDVQVHDLGVTFTLTAAGGTSGSVAVATFTDGNIALNTSVANLVVSFTYDRFNGNGTCTVTAGPPPQPSASNQSVAYAAGLGLNADQSIKVTVPVVAGQTYTGYSVSGGALTVSPASASSNTTLCISGFAGSGARTVTFNYTPVVVTNTAPILADITDKTVNEGQTVSFTANAPDDGLPNPPAAVSYSLGTPSCGNPVPTGAGNASINSSTGAFSWVTDESDDGVYCALIVASDGALQDTDEITITVNEVNQNPVLTVPVNFSTQWGVDPADQQASATDADLPANTLTFSKVGATPAWVTVEADGDITYTTIPVSAVGANVVTVRVEDGKGGFDQESYTITVTNRPTEIDYTGKIAGQYSDESTLSATLVDVGTGSPVGGTPLQGETVTLWFNGTQVCSGATNSSGVFTCDHQVLVGDGVVNVEAKYAGANGYNGDTDLKTFDVSEENAEFLNVVINNGNTILVSQTSFNVTLDVKELRISGNEPDQNDGALPGNIALVTALDARIVGMATNTQYSGSCGTGSGGSASYSSARSFTCTFSGGPFVVDAYTLSLNIPTANVYWVATQYDEGLSVWDPSAGFATGGGTFMFDGDRFSFGFSYTLSKGKSAPRSGFVVVRHMANGGTCRMKSNNQMEAPAVNGNTVIITGKGNYSCTDALGAPVAGQSAGNIQVSLYGEDWGTSGKDTDKVWVSNNANLGVGLTNYLQMPGAGGAAANTVFLRGGNIQVPQPGKP